MSGFTPSTALRRPRGSAATSQALLIAVGRLARAGDPRARRDGAAAPPPRACRRREAARAGRAPARARRASHPTPRPRPRPAMVRGGGGGGLAVATSSAMVCPTCRTEYHGLTYCTRDARRLVPPEEMLGGAGLGPARAMRRSAGLVCMACRRAYEPGLRSCPHDGNELVPFPVYNATRPRSRAQDDRARGRDRADLPGVRREVRSQRAVLRARRRRARRDQLAGGRAWPAPG